MLKLFTVFIIHFAFHRSSLEGKCQLNPIFFFLFFLFFLEQYELAASDEEIAPF